MFSNKIGNRNKCHRRSLPIGVDCQSYGDSGDSRECDGGDGGDGGDSNC
jgi:hypothetical protein